MKYSLRTQNVDISDLDRQHMDEKLGRLHKHLRPPFVVDVSCERVQLKSEGESITCIIRIEQGKKVFHAERTDATLQNALDEAIEAMGRELSKEHDKHKRHGGGVQR